MLELSEDEVAVFVADAHTLMDTYLTLEDPKAVAPIGLELRLEAQVGGLLMLGIIDRLEEDEDGQLVVTDYKTGRAPSIHYEQHRLGGVHFYAFLCEQALGRRPAVIRLMYLRDATIIEARPTERSARFLPKRTEAVWRAISRACETGEFKPRPSRLCPSCAFQDWCPAFGGDPDRAALRSPRALRPGSGAAPARRRRPRQPARSIPPCPA